MNNSLLEADASSALEAKQSHRTLVVEHLKGIKSIETPPQPSRSMRDYPLGRYEHLDHNRLEWVAENYFEFIPKANNPFAFVRSTGERLTPTNFFTDGGSIPRVFRWSADLDPFGYLPPYLLHDLEFDLHHCRRSKRSFEDVNSILMEALHTLMEDGYVKPNWLAFWMIETAINSFVARYYWGHMPPKCPIPPYKPE